jgi:hypothetical protein
MRDGSTEAARQQEARDRHGDADAECPGETDPTFGALPMGVRDQGAADTGPERRPDDIRQLEARR